MLPFIAVREIAPPRPIPELLFWDCKEPVLMLPLAALRVMAPPFPGLE